jgi:hypothetical protein
MALLDKAHFHLTKCSGMEMACKASNALPGGTPNADTAKPDGQGTEEETAKQAAAAAADLAKADAPMIPGDAMRAVAEQNPALDQLLRAVVSLTETTQGLLTQNGEMRKRIEDIAATPVPPRALARTAGLSKVQDGAGGDPAGPVDVTDALSAMSDDDVTKALIKRSLREKRLVVHGFTDGPGPMRHSALRS